MERGLQEEQELRWECAESKWSGWLDYEFGVWGKRDRGGGGGSYQ